MSEDSKLDSRLADWAHHRQGTAPTQTEVNALLTRARRRDWRWPLLFFAAPGLIGALGAAVLLVVVLWRSPSPQEGPGPIAVAPAAPDPIPVWTGHIEAEGDVFDIDGTLSPTGGILALEGRVTVKAAKRDRSDPLVIAADDWRVEVVGTEFNVVSNPFTVGVQEGLVAVYEAEKNARHLLKAGDRFENGRVVRAKSAPPPLPSLEDLKSRVRAGKEAEARAGLTRRLRAHPAETASWTLLARLEGRAGHFDAAAEAWRQVTAHGSPAEAQRARYEAAVSLARAGRSQAAIPLLQDFLKTPDSLAPEARLRLGKAYLASGQEAAGTAELERVVRDHPGTAAATAAKRLLGH